jgi:hypothetical protein
VGGHGDGREEKSTSSRRVVVTPLSRHSRALPDRRARWPLAYPTHTGLDCG